MNARLLVVSGNPSLALLLSREGYEVDEHRTPADRAWAAAAEQADGLVLDLSDALLTDLALPERDGGGPPVLVLLPSAGLCDDIALPRDALQVQLPARPEQVLAGVHEMLDVGRRPSVVGPGETQTRAASPADSLDPQQRSWRLGWPRADVRFKTPVSDWEAVERSVLTYADNRSVAELVRALEPRVAELNGLSAVTCAILDAVLDETQAEAGALLVADGDVWCVEAGYGLRALEERLQVADGSWLVQQVIHARRALLVTGTDIARQRLIGAPLASWQNIMAAPVGDGAGLIVLARADESFTPVEVGRLLPLDAEAADLFADAVLLRQLARLLAPHAETWRD